MPYLMGGFPDLEGSLRIGRACAEQGADLLEFGVPFSDPLADGPVIHAAGAAALEAGATVEAVLDVARRLAAEVPVVVMCYANQILARGLERFLDMLSGASVSGLIVPDLPLEESDAALEAADIGHLVLAGMTTVSTVDSITRFMPSP